MNVALQALLARYEPHTLADYENALKEVIQELAFLGRGIPCDVGHLQARMEQTGHWHAGEHLDVAHLRRLLTGRFERVDYDQARSDVRPFIRDDAELALWDRAFFQSLAAQVEGA